jgi:hypothetical protein
MNDPRFKTFVHMSQYEPTNEPNVRIKMYSEKPKDFKYDCLVFPQSGETYITQLNEVMYQKKKNRVEKPTTFIVFSSSQVILSGRYAEHMEKMYNFFLSVVMAHRTMIEEKIVVL